jgi:hypothetical protein
MKLRVPGQNLYIDFQRNFIHNYNDVNLFLIISLGLVLYCYLNMSTINKTYLILSYLKEKTKTVAGKDSGVSDRMSDLRL